MSEAMLAEVEDAAAAAADGDPEAMRCLFNRYDGPLVRFMRLRTDTDTDAEDLAGDTWEHVARKIHTYDSARARSGFGGWLFTIATHIVIDHYRRLQRRRPVDAVLTADMLSIYTEQDASIDPADTYVNNMRVASAVTRLARKQRQCVHLRFFVGLSLADTAAVMGVNTNAVKQLQHRGLGSLRSILGDLAPQAHHDDDTPPIGVTS